MPRGGARSGAGRKAGSAAGQVQVLRKVSRQRIAEAMQDGRDPLAVALEIAFAKDVPTPLRLQAALGALPFCHPRLSAQMIDSRSVRVDVDAGAAMGRLSAALDRLAPAGAPPVLTATAEPVEADAEPAEQPA